MKIVIGLDRKIKKTTRAELVAIQELLGHSSPVTTLRYAKITHERKREQHKKYLIQ
ncbi:MULTISPECIES: hypothetical protein [Metabacillus]|uniref:Integrase n=1 Tax=Metabacillus elymi TaxID=2745198 RepID=A0ABX6S7E0_9BACI|nr:MULTISPECIES: hypothetical protein [Metabacillus]QNF30010.1 hypothetical protein HUW50_22515 [Metabacillus sp. KUDC1714]